MSIMSFLVLLTNRTWYRNLQLKISWWMYLVGLQEIIFLSLNEVELSATILMKTVILSHGLLSTSILLRAKVNIKKETGHPRKSVMGSSTLIS
mmetsp:Transcript_7844/g.15796  ORF Transcript_7844/g.15796 Transcript_7844/m.15796 type:complete len:93 (+) Transcript_7844:1706-1984(+)